MGNNRLKVCQVTLREELRRHRVGRVLFINCIKNIIVTAKCQTTITRYEAFSNFLLEFSNFLLERYAPDRQTTSLPPPVLGHYCYQ
jgi:hypothetical protein